MRSDIDQHSKEARQLKRCSDRADKLWKIKNHAANEKQSTDEGLAGFSGLVLLGFSGFLRTLFFPPGKMYPGAWISRLGASFLVPVQPSRLTQALRVAG